MACMCGKVWSCGFAQIRSNWVVGRMAWERQSLKQRASQENHERQGVPELCVYVPPAAERMLHMHAHMRKHVRAHTHTHTYTQPQLGKDGHLNSGCITGGVLSYQLESYALLSSANTHQYFSLGASR
eukprot:scaffold124660_cov21-Tisochrysis_lutea.AAC.3